MTRWTADQIPPQSGRTVIVTGANSGIGRVTAAELATNGARVILAVRDEDRGRRAAAEMHGQVEVRHLDLAELASVREFATQWQGQVDVLINNAGIMAVPEGRTADGFELQFGTNHLGHFALTNLLLPQITDRVVTVSSGAHTRGHIELDDLNWRSRSYQPWQAYNQSKLANLLFTLELERRLEADHSAVRAYAAHPGYAATNLQGRTGNRISDRLVMVANKVIAQSEEMGALSILFAATQELPGASYVGPDRLTGRRGHPTLVGRTAEASDVELAKKLWAASEELTGVSYPSLGSSTA
ncbi:MAG TPA: oxidoreductase [Propionibacteriaceae bacterium]|nr:oxidoreductase [Propionibacteriaceae bacterium]